MSYNQTFRLKQSEDFADSANIVQHLQAVARIVLDPLIPEGSEVVMLDYPNNTNVGDSLIWLGEMAYLKSRKVNILYVCDIKNYNPDQLRRVLKNDTLILMHGGGNFGTVWTEIQQFRLQVLSDFSNHTIIQFPQTLSFSDEPSIYEVASAIKKQRNYHLLTRSNVSMALAKSHFDCHVHLCPDMAFFIGNLTAPAVPDVEVLILSRTDHEKSKHNQLNQLQIPNIDTLCVDWLSPSRYERLLHRVVMHTAFFRSRYDKNNLFLCKLWCELSRIRMKRGMALLTKGKLVATDRLHAHILSILMNKTHLFVDNSYGKLGNFYLTWTESYAKAYWMKSDADIPEMAKRLLTDQALPLG